MVSVENQNLRGGGQRLKQQIWDAAKSTIEQWTGMEQQATSMYGIRVYTEGAVLAPHVDRLPLVSSAIVNVAQDLDEPWYVNNAPTHHPPWTMAVTTDPS
jgi:prolyl 4-hydroxylase